MRSEVWCTNCSQQFIMELDLELNGNHEITCPLCQHIHYRVVENGVVTEERYRSSAGPTYTATTSTNFTVQFRVNANTSFQLNNSWLNSSSITLS